MTAREKLVADLLRYTNRMLKAGMPHAESYIRRRARELGMKPGLTVDLAALRSKPDGQWLPDEWKADVTAGLSKKSVEPKKKDKRK